MINTLIGRGPRTDGYFIGTAETAVRVPCITTLPGVFAAIRGIEALRNGRTEPRRIREHHERASMRGVRLPSNPDRPSDRVGP